DGRGAGDRRRRQGPAPGGGSGTWPALLAQFGPQSTPPCFGSRPMTPPPTHLTTSAPRTLATLPEMASHHSLPVFRVIGEPQKNVVERALSIFADVRAGEGLTTLLLTLNVFLLLAGYSVMKPARDGLILTEGGAE